MAAPKKGKVVYDPRNRGRGTNRNVSTGGKRHTLSSGAWMKSAAPSKSKVTTPKATPKPRVSQDLENALNPLKRIIKGSR
jgi:hypothetical protein